MRAQVTAFAHATDQLHLFCENVEAGKADESRVFSYGAWREATKVWFLHLGVTLIRADLRSGGAICL